MLSKPGEARNKTATPSQRRRKVVEENSDDVVRRLQRLPPNKACADCSSKHTQCVNLTHGTFVCMACSGVHREFNHKIKGIGHSSFTTEEVTRLRHPSCGNESVNAHYLAKYNMNIDRMKAPKNNSDLTHLRSWIEKKYSEKKWCNAVAGGGKDGKSDAGGRRSGGTSKPSSNGNSNRSSKKSGERSRRKIMPAKPVVTQPAAAAAAATVHDLFGFDSIAPSAAVSAGNDTSWDAFGESTQSNSTAFSADFGSMGASSTANAPPPVVAAAPAGFQANNFGNFPQQGQQQSTMVSLPPAGQPQQQVTFQANFEAPMANAVQQQPQQAVVHEQLNQMPQQVQHQSTQVQGFANFAAPTQQPQLQTTQQGFANFPSSQQHNQFPQQQTQGGMMGNQQTNQPLQQQHQHPSNSLSLQPSQTSAQVQQQQGNANNFGQFSQQPQNTVNIPQQLPQPNNQVPLQHQPNLAQPLPHPPYKSGEQPSEAKNEVGQQHPSAQMKQDESEHSEVNPNAFQFVENEKKSAFDAFDGLSLEPTSMMAKTPKNSAQYDEGQHVSYSNSQGQACLVTIAKVHYDDALHPYYTIVIGGRERQTDGAHLSLPKSMQQQSTDALSNGHSAASLDDNCTAVALQETAVMLQNLNVQQLLQVRQFIASMVSCSGHDGQEQHQKQTSFGGIEPTPAAQPSEAMPQPPTAEQFAMPQQMYSPGMMQAHQPTGMTMHAPTATVAPTPPSSMPPLPLPPQQMNNPGMTQAQQQPMGTTMNIPTPEETSTPPSAMPPPPPAPVQFSTQQRMNQPAQQHQTMGVGAMNSNMAATALVQNQTPTGQLSVQQLPNIQMMNTHALAPTPMGVYPPVSALPEPVAALPPVEKEGNPFDFY